MATRAADPSMLPAARHGLATLALLAFGMHAPTSSAQGGACNYGPDTCAQGYVWREADARDHVCVLPATRQQTAQENRAAPTRVAGSGPYGPNTCLQGFVWREAFQGDVVCVIPESRSQAAQDNAASARRRACRQ